MMGRSKFAQDFKEVEDRFPKLSYFWSSKLKHWVISGELDICDVKGDYWNTFSITIGIPQSYPNCIPCVIENSTLIPRDIDWHISQEGACCVDIEHNLIAMSKRGINIYSFINEKVYPYFANQIFKMEEKNYAGEEYAHHLDGIIQYYIEDHNLTDIDTVILMLEAIVANTNIGRNKKCPCKSDKKVKDCHLDSIETIKSLGKERVQKDVEEINEFRKLF